MLEEAEVARRGQQKGDHSMITSKENVNHDEASNNWPSLTPHTGNSEQSLQWSLETSSDKQQESLRRESYNSMVDKSGKERGELSCLPEAMSQHDFQSSVTISQEMAVQSSNKATYAENDGYGAGKILIDKEISSIAEPQNSNWEYHGPGSFLSICSKPGIDWVAERTGVDTFVDVAKTFSTEIARPLKLEQEISTNRVPEPGPEAAWKYCQNYFEKIPEATFEVVNRKAFQGRLRAHFESSEKQPNEDDAAWYALRNMVYAFGCRFELGKASYSSTFVESQVGGWAFFENAMSRHTELTFCRSGIMAVQALISMVGLLVSNLLSRAEGKNRQCT